MKIVEAHVTIQILKNESFIYNGIEYHAKQTQRYSITRIQKGIYEINSPVCFLKNIKMLANIGENNIKGLILSAIELWYKNKNEIIKKQFNDYWSIFPNDDKDYYNNLI